MNEIADPVVRVEQVRELAGDLVVIPDRRVPLVPNIGLVGGAEAVLVVDTGMGTENAETVLRFATEFARGRRLYVTSTHFHPEHAFGAHVFAGAATYLVNRAQAADLTHKGPGYLHMFTGLGEAVARRLAGVRLPAPDVVYDREHDLDLGGRVVRLRATGRAHSNGDQVVTVPDAGVMFTGDLVEAGQFAIFPWFPPHDTDVSGTRWLAVMARLAGQRPSVVVPGHGDIGDAGLLTDVHDYLAALRDETWRRRDSAMPEDTIVAEVRAAMLARHPDWEGREWIEHGVRCLCAEHA
ncbi:MBL fold metallo-hydrolase [Actinophytocola algeriensis]|uniref:Glyoxylase-like metal-dependent hydrolase (Beta-lactamase superfamily II) n=1 Tax=Actinophytocola algeriensis TaxID=1768010 RepID=A0A7W7QA49_9PSEU|nr:MBL fold metallo-hydrolase [Actinophytocola algeriensis]MBB4909416.1 glyoxylase-like metal-dependent hydrolase (beta-lactamase superfamily II) [Actinophytocola algeriensis]MBE1475406.1 glyoxylase-like metal-dependent hydrolase (beta-lactamase superfamily II) [Actinophytocola algeriensis]